jgi:ubiquitin-like protein 5
MVEESAKDRMQRREKGEVPARFGGTREQGVRNTMSTIAPSGSAPGGAVRGGGDPLDRMPVKGGGGGGDGDRMMQERVAAMGGSAPSGGAAAGPPSGIPTQVFFHLYTWRSRSSRYAEDHGAIRRQELTHRPRNARMIEVIANDRMGRKGQSTQSITKSLHHGPQHPFKSKSKVDLS